MLRRRTTPATDEFSAEVLAWLQPLYATALRLARNRADAEDLVQDTVVKALRFSDRFTPGTNLKAWLYTILHNTWRNRKRDAARDTVEVDSEAVEDAASLPGGPVALETPERILLRDTLDADLQAALDALPDVFREAVWLRDVEEFTYAEIRGHARRADRYGDVAHRTRPAVALRTSPGGAWCRSGPRCAGVK
jgi:RNA polymerase sigma-70 factor (ECF subfamily)